MFRDRYGDFFQVVNSLLEFLFASLEACQINLKLLYRSLSIARNLGKGTKKGQVRF
jgi:hypothetical protein